MRTGDPPPSPGARPAPTTRRGDLCRRPLFEKADHTRVRPAGATQHDREGQHAVARADNQEQKDAARGTRAVAVEGVEREDALPVDERAFDGQGGVARDVRVMLPLHVGERYEAVVERIDVIEPRIVLRDVARVCVQPSEEDAGKTIIGVATLPSRGPALGAMA